MDNSAAEQAKQLAGFIAHQVEHEVTSPAVLNRTIGESMRHIGNFLQLSASQYLPIRPEEILVKPEPIGTGDLTGVLLVNRRHDSKQGFYILSNRKTIDGELKFSIFAFQANEFDLLNTKFMVLPQAVGLEIIRQLECIVRGEGANLFQCIVVPNYFPAEPADTKDLFSTDLNDGAAAAQLETTEIKEPTALEPTAPAVTIGALPAVNEELL